MSHPVRSLRLRMIALVGGLTLALSVVVAPVAVAQDDGPEAAIQAFATAFENKEVEALPGLFCAEFADEIGGFDVASMTEDLPPGMDVQTVLGAFIFAFDIQTLEVISQTDTEAVVRIVATMTFDIDMDAIGPLIEALLSATGQEVTPDMVTMMTGLMASEFEGEAETIDEEVTLVRGEDGSWLICDELGSDDADGTAAPDGSAAPDASAVPDGTEPTDGE